MSDMSRSLKNEIDDVELARAVRRLLQLLVAFGICTAVSVLGAVLWYERNQKSQHLMEAIERNQPTEVASLLNSGVDPNTANSEGVSALMLASYHGLQPMVETLLQHGAKVDARDNRQHTALRLAGSGHPGIVKLLLDHGADPNAKDFYGKTLLTSVCESGADHDPATLRLLLERGADPNVPGDDGSPLLYAINLGQHGNAEIARLLLQHGANPDAQDRTETPALICAVDQHNPEIIQALTSAKVSLNATDSLGRTALKVAEQNQLPGIAALLKKAGGKD